MLDRNNRKDDSANIGIKLKKVSLIFLISDESKEFIVFSGFFYFLTRNLTTNGIKEMYKSRNENVYIVTILTTYTTFLVGFIAKYRRNA